MIRTKETVSLVVQLRFGHEYGEDALSVILKRDYSISVSGHGVGNILKRAGLTRKRKKKVRKGRQLSDRTYYPGEVGQMDVKHQKRKGYQYDLIDAATRIKYKRTIRAGTQRTRLTSSNMPSASSPLPFRSTASRRTMARSLPTTNCRK